eukprot:NODE_50_length_27150_cov_0.307308.p4 type:complete len:463 gc:universal NODE_50_length_27150_cov_0.307308:14709-13321(-)
MEQLFAYIQQHESDAIQKLKEAVEIPSVSGTVEHRPFVHQMGKWLQSFMNSLGIDSELRYPGKQQLEGKEIDLPPIILGTLGNDPNKKTLLVYGHYDVQPADKENDGWSTDPFKLFLAEDGRLVGRGASDDKGPVLGWLLSIEAHLKLKKDIPVNFKFCFEGMEESGSEGLDALIIAESQKYFRSVDFVCISDNYWLGKKKPCLTYGLRGVSYFSLEVDGPAADLHSGVFGGTIHEPMTDLIHLLSKLVTPQGDILIPGILDSVRKVTEAENEIYNKIDFSLSDFKSSLGNREITLSDDKKRILMGKWRHPSLSLHGIEGAFFSSGAKTVIPAKVKGKFSIRTVPDQSPQEINELVHKYINDEFVKLKSKNKMTLHSHHAGRSWLADINNGNFRAGTRAVERVFGVTPDYTREGGSIPVTLTFQEALKKDVLLLPMYSFNNIGGHVMMERILSTKRLINTTT